MKKFSFVLMIMISLQLNADEIKVKSEIDKVTVFRNGAQITRTASVDLKAGENELCIVNLPTGFDESNILVKTKNKLEVNLISFRKNFAKPVENSLEITQLIEKIAELSKLKEDEQVILETFKLEENLILNFKRPNDDKAINSIEYLVSLADIYKIRILEIKQKILNSSRKITDLSTKIKNLNSQMNELNQKKDIKTTGEVLIVLNSPKDQPEIIQITYIDYRANWSTSYEFSLESVLKPIVLINKGVIINSTSEKWNNVDLTLTTGDARLRTQIPQMKPWSLYYLQSSVLVSSSKSLSYAVQEVQSKNVRKTEYTGASEYSLAYENITFTEYELTKRISISGDGKSVEVTLLENEIAAEYQYIAVPKLDKNVYLQANIIDWNQYNLSSGEVKLYFEGTFVGTSVLDANLLSDTLSISLGPDIAIACKREKLKDLKKTNFLSNKKQIQSGFEISLKNNKPQAIEVVLRDQIPLSTDSEMEIETDELSGGKLNKDTGIVEWKLKLQPGEQVKKKFSYTVKIPKDKRINL